MAFYLLGAGPITLNLYDSLVNLDEETVVVSSFAGQLPQHVQRISYVNFCSRTVNLDDKIVIAWRRVNFTEPSNIVRETLEFLKNNLNTFAKVIYLSSGAVYGNQDFSIDEKFIPVPESLYAKEKLALERWLVQNRKNQTIILRISNVFGEPDFPDLINKILEARLSNSDLHLFDPKKFSRDYISLNQVIHVILYYMLEFDNRPPHLEYVNVSSNIPIKTSKILEVFEKLDLRKFEINSIEVPDHTPVHYLLNNSKLLEEMGLGQFNPLSEIETYIAKRFCEIGHGGGYIG